MRRLSFYRLMWLLGQCRLCRGLEETPHLLHPSLLLEALLFGLSLSDEMLGEGHAQDCADGHQTAQQVVPGRVIRSARLGANAATALRWARVSLIGKRCWGCL